MNNRYEIFAVNIPKGQGNEKAEGSIRVMTWNANAFLGIEDVELVRAGLLPRYPRRAQEDYRGAALQSPLPRCHDRHRRRDVRYQD